MKRSIKILLISLLILGVVQEQHTRSLTIKNVDKELPVTIKQVVDNKEQKLINGKLVKKNPAETRTFLITTIEAGKTFFIKDIGEMTFDLQLSYPNDRQPGIYSTIDTKDDVCIEIDQHAPKPFCSK